MIKVIAEIGWNHCGDMELAKKMILAAKESGATYAKFQSWSVERLKPGVWDEDGRREIYEKAELTKERHIELINYCNENFSTIFISTGTSTFDEIEESTSVIELADLYILHCVSTYPCKPHMANLQRMNTLKSIGFPVGYSDHIEGVESAKVAIGEGAVVIEKHFTIDNDLPGRDNKFAVLPHQMKDLTDYIKMRSEMLIYHGDDFQESELDSRNNYSGRFNG